MSEKEVPCFVAQRIIVKFLAKENVLPSEIFTRLQAQFEDKCMSKARVFDWAKKFREGRDRVENIPHLRRPKTSVTPDNVGTIDQLIRADRRITVRKLSEEVGISVGSVEAIVHNELKYKKVSARWVPRLLTPEQKEARLVVATQLLQRYEREGDAFLDSIVTTDETWLHYYTPESKRASMQWKHTTSPTPKKAKVVLSAGKIIGSFFFIQELHSIWMFSQSKEPSMPSIIQHFSLKR